MGGSSPTTFHKTTKSRDMEVTQTQCQHYALNSRNTAHTPSNHRE